MAENSAIAWTGNAAAATSADYVNWINYALGRPGSHYWTVATPITGTAPIRRLHIRCTATNAEAVLWASTNTLQIGYSPGAITDPYGTPTATAFTGLRKVPGFNSVLTFIGTGIKLAEYEDAMAIFFADDSESLTRYISHFGKIFEYIDSSDAALGIGGHGWIAGRPRREQGLGYWQVGNNGLPSYGTDTQCCLSNPTTFTTCTFSGTYNAGNAFLNDINGKLRLVPQPFVFITAASAASSLCGHTKYIRLYKQNVHEGQLFESNTPSSDQAWIGFIEKATNTSTVLNTAPNTNNVMLWSKTSTQI